MARLGTPENPEIIEPGHHPRPAAAPAPLLARARTGLRLIGFLGLTLAPAVVFDAAWLWLLREGWTSENALAWLLVVLITPAAALSSLLALLAAPLITLALVFLALGRPIAVGRFAGPAARFRVFR